MRSKTMKPFGKSYLSDEILAYSSNNYLTCLLKYNFREKSIDNYYYLIDRNQISMISSEVLMC